MSVRGKVWTIGLFATTALVILLGWDASSQELSIPVGLLALCVCALVAEGAALRSLARGRRPVVAPHGAKAADGVVDFVPIVGVESQDNQCDHRIRRFRHLDGNSSETMRSVNRSAASPTLLGRAVLVSVFVGRDGVAWSDKEIARGHQSLERAGLWIEREASRLDIPVNIGLAETYFQVEDQEDDPVEVDFAPEGDDVGPMEANAGLKSILLASRAAAQLGFRDVAELVERINRRIESDSCVWLFHIRRAGRSFAIPAGECDIWGVGLAICFSREASFPEALTVTGRLDSTTVAHELLHLFGASDKYGASLRSFPNGSVTSRDIMRLNHDSLFRMTIDPLTAYEIGWLDRVPQDANKNALR